MSRKLQLYRLGTVALTTVVAVCLVAIMAAPVVAQDVADLVGVSGKIAGSLSTDVTKLALQVSVISIGGLIALALYMMRWQTRIAVVLEKLASRPCFAKAEDLESWLAMQGNKADK